MATNNSKKKTYRKDNRPSSGKKGRNPKDCEVDEDNRKYGRFSKSKDNDWQWYAQNEQLLKDSASFSYNYPLGTTVTITDDSTDPINTAAVPGVMALYCSPSYGGSGVANSPLNVAIRNIYSFVRHANSGHTNYDAPDMGIYLMAMDNLYSFIAFLRRIYGVVMTFSYTNRYYPTAVVNAMGVDFEDIHQNLADFRSYINSLAVKVGSMCVPASMSVFARHMWMYEGYYVDTDQDKAQTFLYTPSGFFQYTLADDQSGMLAYRELFNADNYIASTAITDTTLLTFKNLHDYGDSLIEPILRSEDMNIMSGDILKAFGRENVYMLPMIPENYVVLPSFNEEVVNQINNATLVGPRCTATQTRDVDPDSLAMVNNLQQDPTHGFLIENIMCGVTAIDMTADAVSAINKTVLSAKRYINFDHGDVSPADTMVASRLTNIIPKAAINTSNAVKFSDSSPSVPGRSAVVWALPDPNVLPQDVTLGSDVAHFVNIFYYGSAGLLRSEMITTLMPVVITVADATEQSVEIVTSNVQFDTARINMLTNFRRHPRVAYQYVISIGDVLASGGYVANIGDLNYWTVVDVYDLKGMAETALLSEFNVTQFGRKA